MENISSALSYQRNFKIVLLCLDKENIFLSLGLEILSSILRGERNLLWMREATKVNSKLLPNSIFLHLKKHVCFFCFWTEEKPCKPTHHGNGIALPKKNANPRRVCSGQNNTHYSEVQNHFNFECCTQRVEECVVVSKKCKLQQISDFSIVPNFQGKLFKFDWGTNFCCFPFFAKSSFSKVCCHTHSWMAVAKRQWDTPKTEFEQMTGKAFPFLVGWFSVFPRNFVEKQDEPVDWFETLLLSRRMSQFSLHTEIFQRKVCFKKKTTKGDPP